MSILHIYVSQVFELTFSSSQPISWTYLKVDGNQPITAGKDFFLFRASIGWAVLGFGLIRISSNRPRVPHSRVGWMEPITEEDSHDLAKISSGSFRETNLRGTGGR